MAQETLLLVDADAQHLRVMEVSLRKAGYTVVTARDGGEALTKLESAQPDLIISDTDMPNQSGYELCQQVRKGRHASVGFIFLTKDSEVSSKVKGLELGADDFWFDRSTRVNSSPVSESFSKNEREMFSRHQRLNSDISVS